MTDYMLLVTAFGAMAFGIFLLIKGGDYAVDGAVYVAERAGLPKLFIGATILAFGTSVPELFTSVNANLQGLPGISIGNILGSNIANILFILGITAVVAPVVANPKELKRDLIIMMAATVLLVGLLLTGRIENWMGGIMFGLIVAYVVYQYVFAGGEGIEEPEEVEGIDNNLQAGGYLLLGLVLLALGSEVLVQGAQVAGSILGVPEAVIGLTVIAFGTSLPELSTCLAAARKGETNLLVGNIIGSNLFNILSIVGLTALIKAIEIAPTVPPEAPEYAAQLAREAKLTGFEMWFMLGISAALAALLMTVGKINRLLGAAMFAGYLAFVAWQYHSVVVSPAAAETVQSSQAGDADGADVRPSPEAGEDEPDPTPTAD